VSIHTLDTRLGQPWLLLASLIGVVFLTNSSTELGREHYLCSTTHGSVWLDRQGTRPGTVQRMPWGPGQALVWPQVASTTQAYGPVHRARGRPLDRTADGCGVREEPTASNTGVEDGRRFDSAEHCLDDHSHGLPRESALRRSAQAVARVCGGRARTTRSRVAQGTAVVHHGNRRGVDAHGCRGQSALNIGWNWVHLARSRGYERLTR
jgi:hypothetical protein